MRLSQIILGLVIMMSFQGTAVENATAPKAVSLQRELLLLVQGEEPVPVNASPALCHPQDQPPSSDQIREWYFGEHGCQLTFPTSLTAIVTTASEGISKRLYESRDTQARLDSVLEQLEQLAVSGELSLQQRLMVQTTAWELAFSLNDSLRNHPERAPALETTVCHAFRLLRATEFKPEDVRSLPSNLAEIPRIANAPEIASAVRLLTAHDPAMIEITPSSDLHADVLFGRFTPRIFLTVSNDSEREALRRYVQDPQTQYQDFANMPKKFADFQAILVLYFNVLTANFTITPTAEVAFLQEYHYSGAIADNSEFVDIARKIQFLTVAYQRNLNGGVSGSAETLLYKKLNQNEMARAGLLDVKPGVPGMKVTTLRASCLKCHSSEISVFQTRQKRKVDFAPPLVREWKELLTPYFKEIDTKLKDGARKCP